MSSRGIEETSECSLLPHLEYRGGDNGFLPSLWFVTESGCHQFDGTVVGQSRLCLNNTAVAIGAFAEGTASVNR